MARKYSYISFSYILCCFFLFFLVSIFLLVHTVDSAEIDGVFQTNPENPLFRPGKPEATYESLKNIFEDDILGDKAMSEDNGTILNSTASSTILENSSSDSSTSNVSVVVQTSITSLVVDATTLRTTPKKIPATKVSYLNWISPGTQRSIVITPEGDQTWAVGSTNNISCHIDPETDLTAEDIYLSMGLQKPPIPHQQVLDNYTIGVTISEADLGSYLLVCKTNSSSQLPCMAKINVGYSPLDVADLECKSWNMQILECSWTIPENPAQTESDDYRTYLISSIQTTECYCDGGPGRCGGKREGCMKTCCSWEIPHYTPAERFLNIRFNVSNPLGSATYNHIIDNWASIIPDAAEDVVLTTSNNTLKVDVQWEMPVYIGTLATATGVRYAVEYRPDTKTYGTSPWKLGSTDICNDKNCFVMVDVEHPGAEYQFRVRLRASGRNFTLEDDGWWSPVTLKGCDIPPQCPWNPPAVSTGTFQVSKGNSAVGCRNVQVAWRPLPILEQNGQNFEYIVNASINGQPVPYTSISNTYVTFNNISEESYLRVHIISSNAIGDSQLSSEVEVMPRQHMPLVPLLQVVVYQEKTMEYEIMWNHGDSEHEYHYTIYLCNDASEMKDPCKGNLYWISVGNMTSVNVTLEDFGLEGLSREDVRFAISRSISSGGISSGMSWDQCYHPQVYKQSTSPPSVLSSIPRTQTSANVSWTLDCSDRGGIVEAVLVEWCHGSHNFSSCQALGSKTEADVFSGQVTITDLDPDTEYYVRLRLQYREKLSGWSTYKGFTTSSVSDPGMAAWLIVTISGGCIIMAVSLVLCYSYSTTQVKKFLIAVRKPIKIPPGLTDVISRPENQQPTSGDPYKESSLTGNNSSGESRESSAMTRSSREVSSTSRELVTGGQDSSDSTSTTREDREEERLIQNGMSPISSPQFPRSPRLMQNTNNYVQADYLPESFGSLPTEESMTTPFSFSQPTNGYMAVDPLVLHMPSHSGYGLQENISIEESREPKMETGKERMPAHELLEISLPSPGYVSGLPSLPSSEEHQLCIVQRENLPITVDGENNSVDTSVSNNASPGYSSIQAPNFVTTGSDQGYVALDTSCESESPSESTQHSASGIGNTQQGNSRLNIPEAFKGTTGNQEIPNESYKEQENLKETPTNTSIYDNQKQCISKTDRGSSYVALDSICLSGLPPEFLHQMFRDSGFVDVQQLSPTSESNRKENLTGHDKDADLNQISPSSLRNKENDFSSINVFSTRNDTGYVQQPYSYDITENGQRKDDNEGKLSKGEDIKFNPCSDLPPRGYSFVSGLSAGNVLIRKQIPETNASEGETLKIDPNLIKSLPFDQALTGYDCDPVILQSFIRNHGEFQEGYSFPLFNSRQPMESPQLHSEVAPEISGPISMASTSRVPDEYLSSAVDHEEAKYMESNGYQASVGVLKSFGDSEQGVANQDNQRDKTLSSDFQMASFKGKVSVPDEFLCNAIDLGEGRFVRNVENDEQTMTIKPKDNSIEIVANEDHQRGKKIANDSQIAFLNSTSRVSDEFLCNSIDL